MNIFQVTIILLLVIITRSQVVIQYDAIITPPLTSQQWDIMYHSNPIFGDLLNCDSFCVSVLSFASKIMNTIWECNRLHHDNDRKSNLAWLQCIDDSDTFFKYGGPKKVYLVNLTRLMSENGCFGCDILDFNAYFSQIMLLVFTDDVQYNLGSLGIENNDSIFNVLSYSIYSCYKLGSDMSKWGECIYNTQNFGSRYGKYYGFDSWYQQLPGLCGLYGYEPNTQPCVTFQIMITKILIYSSRQQYYKLYNTPLILFEAEVYGIEKAFTNEIERLSSNFTNENSECKNINFASQKCLNEFAVFYKYNSVFYKQYLMSGIDTMLSFEMIIPDFQCNDALLCRYQFAVKIYESIAYQCETRFDELYSPIDNVAPSDILMNYSTNCYDTNNNLLNWALCMSNYIETFDKYKDIYNVTDMVMTVNGKCEDCFFEYCKLDVYVNCAPQIYESLQIMYKGSISSYFRSPLRNDPFYVDYLASNEYYTTQMDDILANAIQKSVNQNTVLGIFEIWLASYKNSDFYNKYQNSLPFQHSFDIFIPDACTDVVISNCVRTIHDSFLKHLTRCTFLQVNSLVNAPLLDTLNTYQTIEDLEYSSVSFGPDLKEEYLLYWKNSFENNVISGYLNLYVYNVTRITDFADLAIPFCSFSHCPNFFKGSLINLIVKYLSSYYFISSLKLSTTINYSGNLVKSILDVYYEVDSAHQSIIRDSATQFDLSEAQKFDLVLFESNVYSRILTFVNYQPITTCLFDVKCGTSFSKIQCLYVYSNCVLENTFKSLINIISNEDFAFTNLIMSIDHCASGDSLDNFKICLESTNYFVKFNTKLQLSQYMYFLDSYIYSCGIRDYCNLNPFDNTYNRGVIANLTLKLVMSANIDYLLSTNIPTITTPSTMTPTININTKEPDPTPSPIEPTLDPHTVISPTTTQPTILSPTTNPHTVLSPTTQPTSNIITVKPTSISTIVIFLSKIIQKHKIFTFSIIFFYNINLFLFLS